MSGSTSDVCFIINGVCPYEYIECPECRLYNEYKRAKEKSEVKENEQTGL